jgi:hypothetical protein
MHTESVPVLVHNMEALSKILVKAEAFAESKKVDQDVMLGLRLYPDMFNLARQVQLVTDFAMRCGARLTGSPVPSNPDTEKTFAELQARLDKAIAYLKGLDKAAFEGAGKRKLVIPMGKQERKMSGHDYFHYFLLPNFYFHMATAYNILRHNGVALSKNDFMGQA